MCERNRNAPTITILEEKYSKKHAAMRGTFGEVKYRVRGAAATWTLLGQAPASGPRQVIYALYNVYIRIHYKVYKYNI